MSNVSELIDKLKYHRYRYYELNDPVISDAEYDLLYQQFLKIKEDDPSIPDPIGYPVADDTVKHIYPMLSLRSTRERLEVLSFFSKGDATEMISCEPKIDGIAVELVYEDHLLTHASTRGDGVIGENITDAIKLTSIPKTVSDAGTVVIYGELYLSRHDLIEFNLKRIESSNAPYSNARNAVSGIVRAKKSGSIISKVNLFPYSVIRDNNHSQFTNFDWLSENGFDTLIHFRRICRFNGIDDYISEMSSVRNDLSIDIDGLVFKFNDLDLQKIFGVSRKHPKWAIAYKFESVYDTSRLNEVVFQVGRTGVIAPVGIISPIKIGGVTITRVFLGTAGKINEKDIRINDWVKVERANDVIPHIVDSIKSDRTGQEIVIEFPKTCPVCGGSVVFISPYYICTNPQCKGQVAGRILSAVSRKGFNIYGLGPKRIVELLDNGVISSIIDVFYIDDKHSVLRDIGYTDMAITRLVDEINKAKSVVFNKFIRALCIPKVDEAISSKLADAYNTVSELRKISSVGVVDIQGLSEIARHSINTWFSNLDNLDMFDELARVVRVLPYENKTTRHTVVITGTMELSRDKFTVKLLTNGYKVSKNLSKKTDYLVIGDNPSASKIALANELGIKIVTESDLILN